MGELIPEATLNSKGLQSSRNFKKQGRYTIESTGPRIYKLSAFSNHFTHYASMLHAVAPASQDSGIFLINARDNKAYVTLLNGLINNISFHNGTNPDSGIKELYIKLNNSTDVTLEEMFQIGGLDTFEEVSDVPSYCTNVDIKSI